KTAAENLADRKTARAARRPPLRAPTRVNFGIHFISLARSCGLAPAQLAALASKSRPPWADRPPALARSSRLCHISPRGGERSTAEATEARELGPRFGGAVCVIGEA